MSDIFYIPYGIVKRSWARNPVTFYLFIRLLLKANEQGEIVTSVASLAEDLHLKNHQVRYGLNCLKNDNQIVYQGTNRYTKITICDYESYIESPQGMEEQVSSKQTSEQEENKKNSPLLPPDGSSPCTPSSLTPYIPQEKKKTAIADKESPKRFIKPSVEEIRAYCLERRNGIDAEQFFDHYESKGWVVGKAPMKDWKAAVRTWEKMERDKHPKEKPENLRSSKDLRKIMNNE